MLVHGKEKALLAFAGGGRRGVLGVTCAGRKQRTMVLLMSFNPIIVSSDR